MKELRNTQGLGIIFEQIAKDALRDGQDKNEDNKTPQHNKTLNINATTSEDLNLKLSKDIT